MAEDKYGFYVTVTNGKAEVRSIVDGMLRCSLPSPEKVISAREVDADSYVAVCEKRTYFMKRMVHNTWGFAILRSTLN